MRFFRIPAFTGIETHRDDMDRGSLRTVEGCVPHGPGGLRSGPVWSKIGDVDQFSTGSENHASAADDGQGNSLLFVSRESEVHDLLVMSTENTALVSLGSSYSVINESVYDQADAALTPVGNRLYALGDGSEEAVTLGKGPPDIDHTVFPDQTLYSQEWSRFPNCQFYVSGPKKTIFAAGNPADPLVVYISEPAGATQPVRDNPYSTYETGHYEGMLSEVRILGSNASKITALSTRGDKVVVHTDKGCHILYAPSPDQASTGYRTEQVAATNTSAAVNTQTVAGDGGTQPFWLGHDGQIYKDEAAVRGAEDFKSYADPQQASWKAKGKWEKEHPTNLENSFATYDPQSGMYWVFVESSESALNVRAPITGPTALSASQLTHSDPPVSGPTAFTATQISGPVNGPTGLALVTAPAHGPTGLSEVLAPLNGPTGLSAVNVSNTDICVSNAPQSGTWTLTGTHNGKDYWYTSLSGGRYIWWDSSNSYWAYSSSLGGASGDNDNGGANPWSGTWQIITVTEGTCPPDNGPTDLSAVQQVGDPPDNGPVNLSLWIPQEPYHGPENMVALQDSTTVSPPSSGPTDLLLDPGIPNPAVLSDMFYGAGIAIGDYTESLVVLGEWGRPFVRGQWDSILGTVGVDGNGNPTNTDGFYELPSLQPKVAVSMDEVTLLMLGSQGELHGVGDFRSGLDGKNGPIVHYTQGPRTIPYQKYFDWDTSSGWVEKTDNPKVESFSTAFGGFAYATRANEGGKLYTAGWNHPMWWGYPRELHCHGQTFERSWTNPVHKVAGAHKSWFFIDDEGYLLSYGWNDQGQLGRDPTDMVNWPQQPYDYTPAKTPIYDVINVWACAGSTIVQKSDSSIWGFGALFGGHEPVYITDSVDTVAMGGGATMNGTGNNANVLIRKINSSLWAFGYNVYGCLGRGHSSRIPYDAIEEVSSFGCLSIAAGHHATAYTVWKEARTFTVKMAGLSGSHGMFGPNVAQGAINMTHIDTGDITD